MGKAKRHIAAAALYAALRAIGISEARAFDVTWWLLAK